MKNILTFFVYFFWSFSFAQPDIVFQKTFGGTGRDFMNDMITTIDGGYIILGGTESSDGDAVDTTDVDGVGLHPNACAAVKSIDIWVIKLNSFFEIEWQNVLGGNCQDNGSSIIQSSDGGYLITGSTSSATYSGDIRTITDPDGSGWHDGGNCGVLPCPDIWVIKLNSIGQIEWQNALGGKNSEDGYAGIQTYDGGYMIVGGTASPIGSGDLQTTTDPDGSGPHGVLCFGEPCIDLWAVKLDALGNIEWQNALGGDVYEVGSSVIQTKDSGYIIVGSTNSANGMGDIQIATDPDGSGIYESNNCGLGPGEACQDLWLVKLNKSGLLEWQNPMGGNNADVGTSIIGSADGNYLIGGLTDSDAETGDLKASTDPDEFIASHGAFDIWIVKVDEYGNILWQNALGGNEKEEHPTKMSLDCNGNLFISTDSYTRNINGDKSSANPNNMTEAIWLVLINNNGEIIWDKTIGSGGTGGYATVHDENAVIFPLADGRLIGGISSSNYIGYDKTVPPIGNALPDEDQDDIWFIELNMEVDIDFTAFIPECYRDSAVIFQPLSTSLGDKYIWDFGDGITYTVYDSLFYDSVLNEVSHLYHKAGKKLVSVIAQKECVRDTSFQEINISCSDNWFLPNIFTPNNDGTNDHFGFEENYENIPILIKIYNNRGELVFNSINNNLLWDGTCKNLPVAEGVYAYTVEIIFEEESNAYLMQKGNVMLLR